MEVNTIKCDECGKMRINDTNHWMEGVFTGNKIIVAQIGEVGTNYPIGSSLKHFCGQSCALKWIGIKLGEL